MGEGINFDPPLRTDPALSPEDDKLAGWKIPVASQAALSPSPREAPPPPSYDLDASNLVNFLQGPWIREEDRHRIGSIHGNQINWDAAFDSTNSTLTATSGTSVTMELQGEMHHARFERDPIQKLIWT